MKKSLIFNKLAAILLASSALLLGSCVKNRNDGAVDFSQLSPIVQIVEGGMTNFSASALLFPGTDASDTAYFRVNYAATTTAPTDISVTLSYDAAALAAYNAANPTGQYEVFPDSIWLKSAFPKTIVIKAGQSYSDPVKLTVYPSKINTSKSYMLPITITSASGVNISGNFGTIWYHVIGNPLAGDYSLVGTRYNYSGSVPYSGPTSSTNANIPAGFISTNNLTPLSPKTALPVNAATVTMSFSNLGFGSGFEYGYLITGNNAAFTSITLGWNAAFTSANSNIDGFIMSYTAPTPTQKPKFRLVTHYNNALGGAGSDRIIDEDLVHL